MYQTKISIFVALLLVIAGSVYYYSGNVDTEKGKQQDSYSDTVFADNRPYFTARNDTIPSPVSENLPPGTALIRATILDVEEVENEIAVISVRAEEIMGYGSSTPPIATGTEFSFDVLHYLQRNSKFRNQIKKDAEIKVLISYQEGIKLEGSAQKQDWTFVEFKN